MSKWIKLFLEFLAITSLIIVHPAISQPINNYEGKFTVKVGDQAVYEFSNLKNQSQDYLYWPVAGNDLKLVDNMIFTVKIIDINDSTYNGMINTNIHLQTIIELSNGTKISSPTDNIAPFYDSFIFLAFQSKEDAVSYCDQFQGFVGKDNISFVIDNKNIYKIDNFTSSVIISKYNWHTGWLQSSEILVYQSYYNRTLLMRFYFSKIDTSLYNVFLENLPLLGIIVIPIMVISVFISLKYKKYSKTQKKITFRRYIKKEFTKKHRNKDPRHPINTNKALEMIDEIIHDSDT